jgi:hypothetical protein
LLLPAVRSKKALCDQYGRAGLFCFGHAMDVMSIGQTDVTRAAFSQQLQHSRDISFY